MPHDRKAVDALLATGVSRLLSAAAMLNRMRELERGSRGRERRIFSDGDGAEPHREDREMEYWRLAVDLGEQLSVGGHAINEAHRLMLAELPCFVPEKGGLAN